MLHRMQHFGVNINNEFRNQTYKTTPKTNNCETIAVATVSKATLATNDSGGNRFKSNTGDKR
jgi:hypothetical protein